jgi:hypothetical protein
VIRVGGKVDTVILGRSDWSRVCLMSRRFNYSSVGGADCAFEPGGGRGSRLGLAGSNNILALLHPLNLSLYDDTSTNTWLLVGKLTLWLNSMLMLLNLLPAHPFDGGPIFRARSGRARPATARRHRSGGHGGRCADRRRGTLQFGLRARLVHIREAAAGDGASLCSSAHGRIW